MKTPTALINENPEAYDADPTLFRDFEFIFGTEFFDELEAGALSVECGFAAAGDCDPLPVPAWLQTIIENSAASVFEDVDVDFDAFEGGLLLEGDFTEAEAEAFFEDVIAAVGRAVA